MLGVFFLICDFMSSNFTFDHTFDVVQVVNDSMRMGVLGADYAILLIFTSNLSLTLFIRPFDTEYGFFHVDPQLKQQKPQTVDDTRLNIIALLNHEDMNLDHGVGVILQLDNLIKDFLEVVFKGPWVLLIFGAFSQRDIEIQAGLRLWEVWWIGFGAFYYSFAGVLFEVDRKALVLESLEGGSVSWHFI